MLWCHSTYSLQINKLRTSIALSYFGILLPIKFWKLLQWSEWYGATGENRNFEYKEDKATTQILNLNTKTIENKHFIHYLQRFPQTLYLCFCFCNANISMQVSVFSFSCPKFQCLYIFKNLRVDCFRCKLSSVWPHIFLLNGPDKKPKQNSRKTFSQGLCGADWLVCVAYCIFWHLIGSDQLSYFS